MVSFVLRWVGALLLSTLTALGGLAPEARAQSYDLSLPPGERLAIAQLSLEEGNPADAVSYLTPVTTATPGFSSAEWGAAAYWLGKAHVAQRDSMAAHRAWRAGVDAMLAEDRVNVPLFNAYVRSTYHQGDADMELAASAYLRLLEHAQFSNDSAGDDAPGDAAPDEATVSTLRRHVAQTLLLWPDAMRERVTSDAAAVLSGEGTLRPGAGAIAARWWRRQDPRPATAHNERVAEHLRRVAKAETRFAAETFLGFDDRGRIHLRFGSPEERRSLRSKSLQQSISTNSHFVPPNEYWQYKTLGSYYIFRKQGRTYRSCGVLDLLPTALRNDRNGTGALTALALRDFYDAVTLETSDYGTLLNDVEQTVTRLRSLAMQKRTTMRELADSNSDPAGGGDRYVAVRQELYTKARRVDREVAKAREEKMPASYSEAGAREGGLDIASRTARFLDDDGTTRLTVYWGLPPSKTQSSVAKQLEGDGHEHVQQRQVRLTKRHHAPDYESVRHTKSKQRVETNAGASSPSTWPVFSTTISRVEPAHHVSLQWDQMVESDPPGTPSASIMRGHSSVRWLDSLSVLPAEGALAMSDLVPVTPPEMPPSSAEADGVIGTPYPFDSVDPRKPLGLYFELYHLTFGADDRTRYTVEYVVERSTPRGGLAGLFGREDVQKTATATTERGRSRRTQEYLELDLSGRAGATTLTIVVRVTDEVTGETVYRTLPFAVESPSTGGEG